MRYDLSSTSRTAHACGIARANLQAIGSLVQMPDKKARFQRQLIRIIYPH